jgi:hypothetical protein
VARKHQQGPDSIITIVTARNMPFMELCHNGRSTDYPFGYLQVKIDDKGVGTGQIMAAPRFASTRKREGTKSRAMGNQYIKATNVRSSK